MDDHARNRSCDSVVRLQPMHGLQYAGRRLCRNLRSFSSRPGTFLGTNRAASNRRTTCDVEAVFPTRYTFPAMEYVNLGPTGLKVSRLCLGAMTYGSKQWRPWILEEEEARPFIRKALEFGINYFDTADMYSSGKSEEVLGRALKDFGPGRDRVVMATKVYMPMTDDPNDRGLSRKHIMHSIDNSLKRLGTDYVDLYQIHRFDASTPVEETLRALDDIVRAGKALYTGASAMYGWQFMKMLATSDR